MTAQELLHRLLHHAFAAIQDRSLIVGNQRITRLADLCGPLPLQLLALSAGTTSDEAVLRWFGERSQERGMTQWVERNSNHEGSTCSVPRPVTQRALLYQLLYLALIDVRATAYDARDWEIWRIADVFHNVPLRLGASSGDPDADDAVLAGLRARALQRELGAWLDTACQGIDPGYR